MTWEDKPTDKQLDALDRLWWGTVPSKKRVAATKWLEKHATRKQVSDILTRTRDLYINRKLNATNSFESAVWDGFEYDSKDDSPTSQQVSLVYAILRRHLPMIEAVLASSWLGRNSTIPEVSKEIDRLKDLENRCALDKEECFAAKIWEQYNKKGGD